jgi:hypothetical protein
MSGGVEAGLVDHKGGAHCVGITVTTLAITALQGHSRREAAEDSQQRHEKDGKDVHLNSHDRIRSPW